MIPTSFTYLVQYGRPGFVGRFQASFALCRGERVVIRGPRGNEFGEVLVSIDSRFTGTAEPDDGEILRSAMPEDEAEADRLDSRGRQLLEIASERGRELGLPLAFVDIEVTFDGTAILHALPWDECDATPLLNELTTRSGLVARLLDLSRGPKAEVEESKGCGKPGCGTESGGCSSCGTGGGCSTGSCSRGAVKSSEELSAYFSDLRQKMEDSGMVRTPLN
jgi:hypothetical protein